MTYIVTHGHSQFSFVPGEMASNVIQMDDIATSLAKLCRFNGHCAGHYSVAEHSVLVSYLVPESLALVGLMHDAAEAYIGDLVSPLKALCPEFQAIEREVEAHIMQALDIPHLYLTGHDRHALKDADLLALAIEFYCFFGVGPIDLKDHLVGAFPGGIPDYLRPKGLDWRDARLAFIHRYEELVPSSAEMA